MTQKGSGTAKPGFGVGWPGIYKLELFGRILYDAFGETPYLVGSATRAKTFRDVDVRVMLDEQQPVPNVQHDMHHRWNALGAAFSALGREITGLPIDFQLQGLEWANEHFDGRRHALIGFGEWEQLPREGARE